MNNRDLIRQYVDSGLKIPEYQLVQLSGADKKTYFRKRIIASRYNYNLEKYEVDLMDVSQKNELGPSVEHKIKSKTWDPVEKWELDLLDPKVARNYIQGRAINGYFITKSVFESLPDDEKLEYLTIIINRINGRELKDYEFSFLPDDLKRKYAIRRTREAVKYIRDHNFITDNEKVKTYLFKYLPKVLLDSYLAYIVNNTKFGILDAEEFNLLPIELKHKQIEKIIKRYSVLSRLELSYATDEQKMKYFKNKIESGDEIYLSKDDKDWYERNLS